MFRSLLVLMSVFFITACSMPETKIYNLDIPAEKGPIQAKTDDSLVIRADSPRYLAQPYIAYRSSPYQMEIARYSKWDCSPRVMISKRLKDALFSTGLFKEVRILNIVPKQYYLLDINLKRFERLDEGSQSYGEVVLEFAYFSPAGKELFRSTISKKVRLDDKSFLSLARGLSVALSETIEEVKQDIIKTL